MVYQAENRLRRLIRPGVVSRQIYEKEIDMSENKKTLSRREAIGSLGTVLATAAVVGIATGSADAQTQIFDLTVDKYRALIYSAPQYSWESRIILYDVSQSKSCSLFFMKDGQTIPPNTVAANLISANVYYPRARFVEIRDFLRYEKPVRITVVGSNGIASLSNDEYELVGDLDI